DAPVANAREMSSARAARRLFADLTAVSLLSADVIGFVAEGCTIATVRARTRGTLALALWSLALPLSVATASTERRATSAAAADGRIGLVSIGLSNASYEFARFESLASSPRRKNAAVTLVNGAQPAETADDIADPAAAYWAQLDSQFAAEDVTAPQVQAVWLK